LSGETALVYGATAENWEGMATLAKTHAAALSVSAPTLDGLADLTQKLKGKGVEDIVLDPQSASLADRWRSTPRSGACAYRKTSALWGIQVSF